MNHNDRELIVNKIIAGFDVFYHDGKKYFLKTADIETRAFASICFQEKFEDNIYQDWLSEKQVFNILVSLKLIPSDVDNSIKTLNESLEELKVELLKSLFNEKKKLKTKETIKFVKSKIEKLVNAKHSLDHLTCKGYASMLKMQYLISMSLYNEAGERVYKHEDFDNVDFGLIQSATQCMNQNRVELEVLREIVRTEPWHSYWASNREDIFGKPAVHMSEEQKTLLLYSRMYDSIHQHPECPADEVLEDDDALDGWMIENRRNAEREKKRAQIDKMLGKNKDAQEVYLPASSEKDINKIHDLNTPEAKAVKKSRQNAIEKHGKINEENLPDVRLSQQMRAQRESNEAIKGM